MQFFPPLGHYAKIKTDSSANESVRDNVRFRLAVNRNRMKIQDLGYLPSSGREALLDAPRLVLLAKKELRRSAMASDRLMPAALASLRRREECSQQEGNRIRLFVRHGSSI